MARTIGATTAMILAALRSGVRYGLDVTQRTGLLPGTVYTTLRRLEKRGLIEGRWEDHKVAEAERRPRRRYYNLTPDGQAELERATERFTELAAGLDAGMARGEADA